MPKYSKNQYKLQEVYNHYLSRTDNPVDYKTHKLILDTWGLEVIKYLLEGRDVQLQERLSYLGIRKKIGRVYTDHLMSKKAGRKVLMPNTHSENYIAKLHWSSHASTISCKGWTFLPTRGLKQGIKRIMQMPGGHRKFLKRAQKHNKKAAEAYKTKVLKL